MAFGKITVYSEGGEIEEYELTRPTTSVGRQPGNDIVLKTSAVSRYHAQFDVAGGQVFLVDLGAVNGTFINDVQVEPNSRVPLSDGDVIQMGDVTLVFSMPEAPSRAAISLMPVAAPVEAPNMPFRLILDDPQQSVAPGARLQLALDIENLTDNQMELVIEVGGLDRDWVSVNRQEALLMGKEQTQAMISVRPPRSTQTYPGRYALTVRVALKDEPNRSLVAVREIDVVGYTGLGVAVMPGQQNGIYHVAVQNQGNVPVSIRLGGFDRNRVLAYRFSPSRLDLAPGQTMQATLQVRLRQPRSAGSLERVLFAVVARSLDAAGYQAPVLAEYRPQVSWLPWLAAGVTVPLILGAGLLVAAVLFALIYFEILPLPAFLAAGSTPAPTAEIQPATPSEPQPQPTLFPTPDATIVDFYAEPDSVFYHTMGDIALHWQVTGAVRVELLNPRGVSLPLSADNLSTSQYRLPIRELDHGIHSFTLTVTGQDGVPVSRVVILSVLSVVCSTVGGPAPVFTLPDPAAPPAPVMTAPDLVITGRTPDARWVQVAYNDLQSLTIRGWLPADQVVCPMGSVPIDQYVVIEVAVTPQPTLTPTGEMIITPTPGQ